MPPTKSTMYLGCLTLGVSLAMVHATNRPHIVFIVADDLGWNDVSWHGSGQVPVPNLAELATSGLILDNYYVQPVCSPTRSSIMTGRHVIHTGIYDPDCGPGNTNSVPINVTMLPFHLNKLGYESHAVGKWHLGMFSRQVIPTGKGFQTFFGYYSGAEDYFTHVSNGATDWHNDTGPELGLPDNSQHEYSTYVYARRARALIQSFSERYGNDDHKSLFLYLAFQAIHSPDEVPDSYRDRFNTTIPDTKDGVGQHRRTVAGMIACLDEGIGNVTAALKETGMLDNTLIVFTTDNGGPAQGFNNNWASNTPLRGMKRTLWQGGVRGAGFIRGPGIRARGEVSVDLMHACDWFPTLLSAAQAGDGEQADWESLVQPGVGSEPAWQLGDGVDVWDTLSKGAPSPRTEVLIEAHNNDTNKDDGNGQAIVVGDLKLILEKGPMWHGPPNDGWYDSGSNPQLYNHTVNCGGPAPQHITVSQPPALFNLTADPCEFKDIKDEQPADFQRLLARLAVYQATAVDVSHHQLPLCPHPSSPVDKPVDGNWMPVCP